MKVEYKSEQDIARTSDYEAEGIYALCLRGVIKDFCRRVRGAQDPGLERESLDKVIPKQIFIRTLKTD